MSLLLLIYIHRFNSRTPGGVRHRKVGDIMRDIVFQFTHPGRGATSVAASCASSGEKFQFTHPGRGATGTYRGGLLYR